MMVRILAPCKPHVTLWHRPEYTSREYLMFTMLASPLASLVVVVFQQDTRLFLAENILW